MIKLNEPDKPKFKSGLDHPTPGLLVERNDLMSPARVFAIVTKVSVDQNSHNFKGMIIHTEYCTTCFAFEERDFNRSEFKVVEGGVSLSIENSLAQLAQTIQIK